VTTLKAGDRVRVAIWTRMRRYHPGEKGTVVQTLWLNPTGAPFYQVTMDIDSYAGGGVFFNAGEIEPDA
jgi:hypothetical protein